ncbi:MAG: SAM-dependent methyltransferase [Burkholderiaceae bacterium]|nr:SAM-dependent methyltransferase [Burkholderiaceae bacterium]
MSGHGSAGEPASAPPPGAAATNTTRGRLVLVPNTLDLGATPQDLAAVLPPAVLQWAARLQHWIVEDAKSARAFLKRVHEVVPLQAPLQALSIVELPRPAKGAGGAKTTTRAAAGHATGSTGAAAASQQAAHCLAPALAGHDIGLLSEAGLPAVADPGAAVVAAAHTLGVPVLALPGPSSLMLALAASGLDGQSFAFVGYLPQEAGARRERIRELEAASRRLKQTQIFIETPYRNTALFAALLDSAAPTTRLSISVALTLPEGWSRTAPIAQWRAEVRKSASASLLPDRLPAVFLLQA